MPEGLQPLNGIPLNLRIFEDNLPHRLTVSRLVSDAVAEKLPVNGGWMRRPPRELNRSGRCVLGGYDGRFSTRDFPQCGHVVRFLTRLRPTHLVQRGDSKTVGGERMEIIHSEYGRIVRGFDEVVGVPFPGFADPKLDDVMGDG